MSYGTLLRAVPLSLLAALAAPGPGSPAAEVTSGRVPVDGGSLYFESAGEGPAVVLVHDGLVASDAWRPVLERLAPYCRAMAYDRRGCGKSDPAPEKYSDLADLDAVVRNTDAGAVAIAASFYGSQLTLDYALERPDRVNAMVLVGPVVSGMPQAGHFLERNYRNFAPFSARKDLEAAVERWINDPYLIAPGDAAGRARFGEILRADPRAIRGAIHPTLFRMQFWPSEKLDPPAAGRLKEVTVPTLVIAGEGDTDFVKRAAAAVADGIPGAELVLIAGANHLPQTEKPLEVNRHLRRLLQRGPSPGR